MKKLILALTLLVSATLFANAQPSHAQRGTDSTMVEQLKSRSEKTLLLNVNTMEMSESQKINAFIENQRRDRSFLSALGGIGIAVLNTVVTQIAGIGVSSVMDLIELPKKQEAEWKKMIQNECSYKDSLIYINNLTDFYSKGSSNGALDPSDFNFNGFTLHAMRDGKDVLLFYSHVDTDEAGLNEIVNHSKFRLVLDSMYFYPYRCHLPNLKANQICPVRGKTYERGVYFNFEERENLTVSIDFVITSSWYNQAVMLAKDVELGAFSVQVPIAPELLTDSVFVYKRMLDDTLTRIAGSCFVVPRSYMPLTGGVPHWGTGEYNVKVTVSENCAVTNKIKDNWKKDYRHIKKMRKNHPIGSAAKEFCIQQGTMLLRCSLQTATTAAIKQWEWINSGNNANAGIKITGGK